MIYFIVSDSLSHEQVKSVLGTTCFDDKTHVGKESKSERK